MLILRHEHLVALREAALETFVDRMVEHLGGVFPAAYREHGVLGLREIVQDAVTCAGEVGITSEAGICRYAEAWLRHGVAFDLGDRELQRRLRDGALTEDGRVAAVEAAGRGVVAP